MDYKHREAFCLMQYASKDNTEREMLWNSRDGVTPFVLKSRNGKDMYHVDWQNDVCDPSFKPPKGMRVFIDASEELVTPRLKDYIDKIFKSTSHTKLPWRTREDAFARMLPSWVYGPTETGHNPQGGWQPWIIEVE